MTNALFVMCGPKVDQAGLLFPHQQSWTSEIAYRDKANGLLRLEVSLTSYII